MPKPLKRTKGSKMRIALISDNEYLYQKIRILLRHEAEVEQNPKDPRAFDMCIWDTDTATMPICEKIISVGTDGADIPYPVPRDELHEAIRRMSGKDDSLLTLGEGCVYLRGHRIELTEVEHSLISALFNSRGKFISRRELLLSVWNGSVSESVLNVYVHYLRQKLEDGEKIIISSRGEGYKIDEKYL